MTLAYALITFYASVTRFEFAVAIAYVAVVAAVYAAVRAVVKAVALA